MSLLGQHRGVAQAGLVRSAEGDDSAIRWRVLATDEAGVVRVDVDTGNGFRAATVAEVAECADDILAGPAPARHPRRATVVGSGQAGGR